MTMTNVLQGASKVKASIGTSKEVRRAFDSDLETCWSYDLVCARQTGLADRTGHTESEHGR